MIVRQIARTVPEVPLAGHVCPIALALEAHGDRLHAFLQVHGVARLVDVRRRQHFGNGAEPAAVIVHAREQHGARGRALRRCPELREHTAAGSKVVDIRRAGFAAVGPEVGQSNVIGKQDHYVRRGGVRTRGEQCD